MEYWKEIFKDMIQEDYYEVKLINGEEYGLIIKFQGKYNAFSVKFGEVKAVRMIDEGIVQTDIYSENEVQKYIDEMKADGTMTQISEKWFGKDVVSR